MTRLNDMFNVYQAELNLIKQQSALLLQKKTDGFGGELKSSGTIIELYIKHLLAKHLPNGYRICSGYVATAPSIAAVDNLVQHDIIIVDGRYPTLYRFGIGDIEVVPAEAVCGIVEAKRTLTQSTIINAIDHLNITRRLIDDYANGIKSKRNANNNLAGPTFSVSTGAPIYAIVGLNWDKEINDDDFLHISVCQNIIESIDFIWALANPWLAHFVVEDSFNKCYFPSTVSRTWDGYNIKSQIHRPPDVSHEQVYGRGISGFRQWINNTSGVPLSYDNSIAYFGA